MIIDTNFMLGLQLNSKIVILLKKLLKLKLIRCLIHNFLLKHIIQSFFYQLL